MAVPQLNADIVKLVPGNVDLESRRELTQHFITSDPISPIIIGEV